ncbi:hypothetical protein CROQUDRAFT_51479, partial [Cronartium quercuum f. sp. fusiforme G11]
STKGIEAYHAGLHQIVLVMSCVLAHIEDCPMNAEITNNTKIHQVHSILIACAC